MSNLNCITRKLSLIGLALFLSLAGSLTTNLPALSQGVVPPPRTTPQGTPEDSNVVNPRSVRDTYFLRYPYANRAEERTRREPFTEYPLNTVEIGPEWGEPEIIIPPGPNTMLKAARATVGDAKAPTRPQYWPLYKPCGTPGFFLPPTPPVIMSSSILNPRFPHPVMVRLPMMYEIPCYIQPYLFDTNRGNIAQARDEELWDYELTTFGVGPISDTQFQMIDREDNQRFLELLFDPERWMWAAKSVGDMQRQSMTQATGGSAEHTFDTAVFLIDSPLINIANENAADPVAGNPQEKTLPQAVYMIQRCYRELYIPMAILFLLPGAVITQMKGLVSFGLMGKQDEDTKSPFSGILRALIAVFLIPATQLAVSYCIDIGNSMSYEVSNYLKSSAFAGLRFPEDLLNYAHEELYNAKPPQSQNVLIPPPRLRNGGNSSGGTVGGMFGKGDNAPENRSEVEQQYNLSVGMQLLFNMMNVLVSNALSALTAFQIVMMAYLFLLGPIAAALFAWPAGFSKMFKEVFANWLDAVTVLSLWKFWWMVVLACMFTRMAWLIELGEWDPTSKWEMMMFTCFMGLLMYVPFQPFKFDPGSAAAEVLENGAKATSALSGKSAEGGKGGGGGSGAGGGNAESSSEGPSPAQHMQEQLASIATQASMVSGGLKGAHSGLLEDGANRDEVGPTGQLTDRARAGRIRDALAEDPDKHFIAPPMSGDVITGSQAMIQEGAPPVSMIPSNMRAPMGLSPRSSPATIVPAHLDGGGGGEDAPRGKRGTGRDEDGDGREDMEDV